MVDSKRKGSNWERKVVKLLNERLVNGEFKRVPGSGAFGSVINEPGFLGDIYGEVFGFPKRLRGEAKIGYGGATQFSLKKEWLDKIKKQAKKSYSFPFLVGRFSNSRVGVENFIVLDLDDFCAILNLISELSNE